jgi:hypothetical protein
MPIERIAIDPAKDRATWLALRMQDITASDVPAVCGEGMFGSAAKVWAEKRGLIGAAEMTEPMKRGIWGEAAVFEALAWEYPEWEIRRAKIYLRDTSIGLGATPDGAALIPGKDGITIVQAKVISKSVFQAHWIGEDADLDDEYAPIEAPMAYQLQTLTETMLAEAPRGIIAALIVDEWKWRLRLVPVERHAGAEAIIRDRVVSFRRDYLETGIQPLFDPERDEQLVKLMFPNDNGLEVDLSSDNEMPGFVDRLAAARAFKKQAESEEAIAKTAIAGKLGNAAIARIADGRRVSNKTQDRAGYVVEPTSFRVMRILKGRG